MIRSKRIKMFAIALLSASLVIAGCSDDESEDNNGQVVTDAGSDVTEDAANNTDAAGDADQDAGSDAANDATGDTGQDATTSSSVVEVDCDSVTADHTVTIMDSAYDPAALTVSAGNVVQWTNDEPFPVPHTVTSGRSSDGDRGELFDSGDIAQGDSYCLRFDEVGSFQYFCTYHPVDMNNGEITVE